MCRKWFQIHAAQASRPITVHIRLIAGDFSPPIRRPSGTGNLEQSEYSLTSIFLRCSHLQLLLGNLCELKKAKRIHHDDARSTRQLPTTFLTARIHIRGCLSRSVHTFRQPSKAPIGCSCSAWTWASDTLRSPLLTSQSLDRIRGLCMYSWPLCGGMDNGPHHEGAVSQPFSLAASSNVYHVYRNLEYMLPPRAAYLVPRRDNRPPHATRTPLV